MEYTTCYYNEADERTDLETLLNNWAMSAWRLHTALRLDSSRIRLIFERPKR